MEFEYDEIAKAGYLYLADNIGKGEAVRTVRATDDIILDFDKDGHLIGVEFLSPHVIHPDLG